MPANLTESTKKYSSKIPPYSIEAEQCVLGAMMLDPDAWDKISGSLSYTDFYQESHRIIFQSCEELVAKQQPIDYRTISESLKQRDQLTKVGGDTYLYELANNTPSIANVDAYATIVRERSILRQLISCANKIAERAFHPEGRNTAEILEEVEGDIFSIATHNKQKGEPVKLSTLLAEVVSKVDRLYHNNESVTGMASGFKDLDALTTGFHPGELIVIAGRPAMGKTAFALNIAEKVSIESKLPVLIFSLEMPGDQLALRLLSAHSRINQLSLRTGKITDQEWGRISSALEWLSSAPIFIDETPALNPGELRSKARRLSRQYGKLGLIVIDYMQLMHVPGRRETRALEISDISRSLKVLAKELSVPVIALSQLNRSLEQRQDRRPLMSDLRESGSIEQDADIITFIYRDEVYNENSPDKGKAEIILAKQRNGPIGKVMLTFLREATRFENYSGASYPVEES